MLHVLSQKADAICAKSSSKLVNMYVRNNYSTFEALNFVSL